MLKLIIEDDEGRKTVVPFVREEITIGRQEGNTIRLTERNVSRRHARLLRHNGDVVVEDLGSYNGIRINGEKISGQAPIQDGDLIQIGDYDLAIQHEAGAQAPSQPPVLAAVPPADTVVNAPPPVPALTAAPVAEASPLPPPLPEPGSAPRVSSPGHVIPQAAAAAAPTPIGADTGRRNTSLIRREGVPAAGSAAPNDNGPAEIEEAEAIEELDAADAPKLVVLNTHLAGREFALIRTELRLGRTDENDITVDHRSLSRTHARIHRDAHKEWRISDLQSANGINVNGELYSQSALQNGDTIELGHVKFRFVGPGETYRFVPPPTHREMPAASLPNAPVAKPRSKLPAVLLAVVVVGGGAAVGLTLLIPGLLGKGTGPDAVAQKTSKPEPDDVAPVVVPPVPSPSVSETNARMRAARDAMALKKFEKAKDVLESLRSTSALSKEGTTLLAQAETEIAARQNLPAAEKLIAQNKLDDAESLLEQSKSTVAFAALYNSLNTRLETARARERKMAARRPPEKPAAPEPKTVEKPAAGKNVEKFAEDGSTLIKRGQPEKAVAVLRKCLDVNPQFPRCHKLLGSAYATLHDGEKGATHYRKFLELAPNDDSAAAVRQLLEAYDANKRAQTSN